MLFSISCVFRRLGDGQEYPYLLKGAWVLGILVLMLALLGECALGCRLDISSRLERFTGLTHILEYLLAALLLLTGAFLRFQVIRSLPMEPDSDYKTYYEMAVLLNQGTLVEAGTGYCDYVSMFPHVFGYPVVLSWILGIFGESVYNALLFNLVLEVGICVAVWRISRLLGGRLCGMVSLAAVSFLPSTILYSNFTASEPLFTFALLVGIWLFALSLKGSERQTQHPWLCAIELAAMAFVLAFASFIRPMAVIFLIAAVICLLPGKKDLPALPQNDIPLGLRLTSRGFKRCALVCAVYFSVSSLFTMATGYAVNRQLAGSASYGYNLLVGLNLESYGGWNEADAQYLYSALEATGSAQEAQLMCRDMALERLKVDPRALLNLFVHKFEVLWGNDDFGASWNILFLDQQGNLTPARESFLYQMMDVSDLYYLTLLFFSGLYGFLCFRRSPDSMYACLLLFCGTVALHLMVENQNRYHYHALALLCLMTGISVRDISDMVRRAVMDRLVKKQQAAAEKAARDAHVFMIQQEETDRARLRAEALHAQFDMGAAIREGHIRIVASKGVIASNPALLKPVPKQQDDNKKRAAPEQRDDSLAQAATAPKDKKHKQTVSKQKDETAEQAAPEQKDNIAQAASAPADKKRKRTVSKKQDDTVVQAAPEQKDNSLAQAATAPADKKPKRTVSKKQNETMVQAAPEQKDDRLAQAVTAPADKKPKRTVSKKQNETMVQTVPEQRDDSLNRLDFPVTDHGLDRAAFMQAGDILDQFAMDAVLPEPDVNAHRKKDKKEVDKKEKEKKDKDKKEKDQNSKDKKEKEKSGKDKEKDKKEKDKKTKDTKKKK